MNINKLKRVIKTVLICFLYCMQSNTHRFVNCRPVCNKTRVVCDLKPLSDSVLNSSP